MSTMQEIRNAAKKSGSHWFSRDTMRFFGTTLHNARKSRTDRNVAYFISCEDNFNGTARFYTVRKVTLSPFDITNASEFQEFYGLETAQYFLRYHCP